MEYRDRLIAGLRTEQEAAKYRVDAAKQQGASPDAADREVATWLATGLCDLLADPITGESFVKSGRGVIARLASGEPEARFAEADFLRPDGIRFMEAGRAAQSMLTKLSLISTNQFRAAAARLLNSIVEVKKGVRTLSTARSAMILNDVDEGGGKGPDTFFDPSAPAPIILVEDAAILDGFAIGAQPCSLIVASADESALRKVLPASAVIYRYEEPRPAVVESPGPTQPVVDRLAAEFQEECARARLFVERGVLAELPETVHQDASEPALHALRQALTLAWQHWFAQKLADFDAEWFLAFEEFEMFGATIAAIQDAWQSSGAVGVPLPSSGRDFELAEKIFAEFRRLEKEWSIYFRTPVDEGIAFDAAVAAGAACSTFHQGVEWWLRTENRDWSRYRIVRVES